MPAHAIQTTTFAPQRISRESGRPKRSAVALAAAFGVLVAVAAVGRPMAPAIPDRAAEVVTAVLVTTAPPSEAPTTSASSEPNWEGPGWPPLRANEMAFAPVLLDRPQLRGAEIRTAAVPVEGVLRIKADRVRVALQTLDFKMLASASVRTANLDGGIRPIRAPTIDVDLPLPDPRPTGERLWLVLTAYDARGSVLAVFRRTVTIAPLDEP